MHADASSDWTDEIILISFGRFRKKPTKEATAEVSEASAQAKKTCLR
jgi:hypothetical protein